MCGYMTVTEEDGRTCDTNFFVVLNALSQMTIYPSVFRQSM